jgi:hypothetical protein
MLDSDAPQGLGDKKVRKAPQVIDSATWKAVEAAVCIGGLGYSEAGRKFDIEPHAIMARARRNKWPVPSVIVKRAEALQKGRSKAAERYKPYEEARNRNEEVIEVVAQSWAERGEQHRVLTFNLAHSELKAASKRGLPIEDWSAAEKASQAVGSAREACADTKRRATDKQADLGKGGDREMRCEGTLGPRFREAQTVRGDRKPGLAGRALVLSDGWVLPAAFFSVCCDFSFDCTLCAIVVLRFCKKGRVVFVAAGSLLDRIRG